MNFSCLLLQFTPYLIHDSLFRYFGEDLNCSTLLFFHITRTLCYCLLRLSGALNPIIYFTSREIYDGVRAIFPNSIIRKLSRFVGTPQNVPSRKISDCNCSNRIFRKDSDIVEFYCAVHGIHEVSTLHSRKGSYLDSGYNTARV